MTELNIDDSSFCEHPADAVMWNPYNRVTQCHRCGQIIANGNQSSSCGVTIFNWPNDIPVHQAIFEALGAASMCWSDINHAGVFDSERAAAIGDELIGLLQRKLWIDA